MNQRRRLLSAALGAPVLAAAMAVQRGASAQGITAGAPTANPRSPDIQGFALGMPLDLAVRQAQAMAPSGSVTLPLQRRDPFVIVGVEAPVAFAPQPAENPDAGSKGNFYVLLNSAPRILKTQPTRSTHVGFITLVADRDQRRLVRVVLEPAFVHWQNGLDAAQRTPGQLADDLSKRYSTDVRVVAATRHQGREARSAREPGEAKEARVSADMSGERDSRDRGSAPRDRPAAAPGAGSPAVWELRVHADRKSVVLTDRVRLPDDHASRLRLD